MAGEMLASAIVKQVAGKLCSSMWTEVGLVWGLEKSLDEMKSTFSTLNVVLEDAERRSIREPPVCDWLKKLKDAAYDIDDLLNEFQAKLDNDEEERKGGGARCILSCFSLSNPLVFRSTMAHRMETLREGLDKIAADRIKFHLQVSSSVSEWRLEEIEKRETFSEIDESMMIYGSRHEDREKIVRFLLKSGEEEEVVSVIPIVGLGGMGKTTVAKLAFNDERVKHARFDLRIWVYVSMDFDLKRVARSIISSGAGASCDHQNLESMKNRIKDLVKGKRFLVVLDDVWTEDADEWENLKLLLRGGMKGSKIIVTARSESVALLTGTVSSHRLKGLSEEECWTLIKRRAFRSGDEERRTNLVVIGRQIAKKCSGVPLAANAVGTMLRFKLGEETWSAIRDSRNWEVENDQDRVLSSLKLSYYEMPAGLKQCFAYCSIFPKGYKIDKNKLIYQWISLGFIQQSKNASFSLMEEIGNEYINILLWMSFLQDLEEDTEIGIVICKMHDLVHDLARSVAAGEVSVVENQKEARDFKECRYASFAGRDGPSNIPKCLLMQVRALHFRENGSVGLADSIFSLATRLCALDLTGCWLHELPTSIGKLKNLRYLDAPHLPCKKKPKFLQFLKNLQVLDLSDSSFSSLPKSIGNISKLHLINLSGCHKLQGLPASIGNLQNLHYLNLSWCSELQDLPASLGNLQNLHHLILSGVKNLQDLPASIGNLQNLHHLNLSWCRELQYLPASIGNLQNLHHLNLSSCTGLQYLPASIGNLQNLHHLNLSYCNLQVLPPCIAGLGNLQIMILSKCTNLKNIPPPIHLDYFPKLETLDLCGCYGIASFPNEIFDSTNLKHLKVLENNSLLSTTFIECGGKHINTEELEHQNRTGNELEIIISIERMDHPRDARRVDLSKKQNVRSLVLRSGSQTHYLAGEYITRVLSYLSPHPNLKVLELEGYMGGSFPSWMKYSKELRLQNLVELTLQDVTLEDYLPSLGHLPSLEVLRLMGMHSVEYLSCDAQYPSLKELELTDMRWMKKWTTVTRVLNGLKFCEVFMYPCLEKLTITGCPSLMPQPCLPASVVEMVVETSSEAIMSCEWRTGPSSSLMSSSASSSSSSSSSSSTTLLKTLYISEVDSTDGWKGLSHHTALEELIIESCNLESLPDSIQRLTCLRSLIVSDCSSLHSLPAWLGNLTSLHYLMISKCPSMIVSRDIMEGLTSLLTLKISGCPNLANLPEMLENISSLQVEIS